MGQLHILTNESKISHHWSQSDQLTSIVPWKDQNFPVLPFPVTVLVKIWAISSWETSEKKQQISIPTENDTIYPIFENISISFTAFVIKISTNHIYELSTLIFLLSPCFLTETNWQLDYNVWKQCYLKKGLGQS